MATEVIVPKVDMVMEEATFVEWLKQEGEFVVKGEPLFIILTDKANIEVEAPASGILAGISAQPDDVIPVAAAIAYILAEEESLPASAGTEPTTKPVAEGPPAGTAGSQMPIPVASGPAEDATSRIRATPVARRLAAEMGVDLAQLAGRGPDGRIHKADVLAAAQRLPDAAPSPVTSLQRGIPLPDARRREVVPLSGPRRIIAERMTHSALSTPHITLSLHVDMSEAIRLRARLLEPMEQKVGHRLSFTAIVARAVAAVLPKHPYLNGSWGNGEIVLWEDVHLGIATSVEDYLVVPTIRRAQEKNLEQIVSALGDLTERARSKRLAPAEMSGSTFTITNLGMFGIESFTAIINPPEAAILAVGSLVDRPVSAGGEITLRPMMNLTLSADHRVVDGATAARFLADLKATLENPYLLI